MTVAACQPAGTHLGQGLVETLSAELTVTQPHEIALYSKAFTELTNLATYGAAARTLITSAITALDA